MREHKKLHLGIIGWAMILTGAMSLGSCSSDETLDAIEPKAITFGSVTMENLSRAADPSYGQTTNPLDEFQVWGTVTGNAGTANIYSGATVTNTYVTDATKNYGYGQVWSCTQTQYWIPNATYHFMAIANATSVTNTTGIPTAINYTADGTSDLLLGELATAGIKTVTTNASCEPTQNPVSFTMTHLLSKVHFTFDGSADIKAIQVTGHYGTGTYNISGDTSGWVTTDTDKASTALSFGVLASDGTSEHARLIIPGEQEWTINLLDANGDIIGNSIILNNATATGNEAAEGGFTFEANKQYNIKITLDVKLSLSVAVQDWTPIDVESAFAQTPSAGQKIQWITDVDNDGKADYEIQDNQVILNDDINVPAKFTFKLTGPKGGEWIAYFVKEGGVSNAFTLNIEGDDSRDVTCQGKVGESDDCLYTIEVRAKGVNNTAVTNKAELRFMIRQAGQLLPVDVLTTLTGSRNYKILQNPPLQ